MTRADREAAALKVGTRVREPAATIATPVTTTGAAATTIRITYVRLAGRYRIDEVTGDGVVREEISPAVFDEAFAEHLAALVADFDSWRCPAASSMTTGWCWSGSAACVARSGPA